MTHGTPITPAIAMPSTNPTRTALLSLSFVALAACESGEAAPLTSETLLRSAAADACSDGLQIAAVAGPDCPDAGADWDPTAIGPSGNHCRYEWTGAGAPDLGALGTTPGINALSADCQVLLPQELDAMSAALAGDLRALFRYGIGHADALDLDLVESESARAPVMVAVLDTIPPSPPGDPESDHGVHVAQIVQDVVCPDPEAACAVDVRTFLGLPRVAGGAINPNGRGGYIGTQGDLALAIHEAVDAWESENAKNPTKLIVNLSIGWESAFGGVAATIPRVQAVREALERVSCVGGLAVASAGNQGHLCTTDPLLPGAWESTPAPTVARCSQLGITSTAVTGYHPLVHAVGGLGLASGFMAGTREDGMPRLSAVASHAVAGETPMTPMTGTSIAAAVGSGAAGLVWSFAPHLDSAELMQIVYESGTDQRTSADFHLGGWATPTVRRINACQAIDTACADVGSSCPTMPLECLDATPPMTKAQFFDLVDALTVDQTLNFAPFGPAANCPSCGPLHEGHNATSVNGDPCPSQATPGGPYNGPQPWDLPCPTCTIDAAAAVVKASLDRAFAAETITDVNVTVNGPTHSVDFNLGAPVLTPDDITDLQLDAALMPSSVRSATISISFDGYSRPFSNDLIVD